MATEPDTEHVSVEVVARATLTLPKGYTLEGNNLNYVRTPLGELLKFWVSVELAESEPGDEVNLDLTTEQLHVRGISLEHDGTTLVED